MRRECNLYTIIHVEPLQNINLLELYNDLPLDDDPSFLNKVQSET